MLNKEEKKMLKRDYMESTRPMGVFRVQNTVNGKSLIGTSRDLPAMLNRQRAQLQLNSHMNADLQSDWNREGEDAFVFEVLDTLEVPEDRPEYNPADDLKMLEQLWMDKLSPFGDKGYHRAPGA